MLWSMETLLVDYHEAMLLPDAKLPSEMLAYTVKFFPNFLTLLMPFRLLMALMLEYFKKIDKDTLH